jgi:hypothetical protein
MARVLELQTLAAPTQPGIIWRSSISVVSCGKDGRSTLSGAFCVVAPAP